MAGKSGIFGQGGGFGGSTVALGGGAVSDLFAAGALRTKARGSRIEGEEYKLAERMSLENAQFAETSTAVKQAQLQRGIMLTLGQQQADVAASGFIASGSALDLLRDSAAQGALTKAVAQQQGIIEEDAYKAQAQSYALMAEGANLAAAAGDKAAQQAEISAGIKGIAALATMA